MNAFDEGVVAQGLQHFISYPGHYTHADHDICRVCQLDTDL